jgi:hypothetical protein
LFTNSGEFQVRYSSGENGSCDLRNLTVLSSTAATAFKTQAAYADTTRNDSFNLNGLSVDGSVDFYARGEFQMNDWVVKKLFASLPGIGWNDVYSWLSFDADSVPVGSAKTSNIYFRNDKFNPHGYGMGSQHMTGMALREIDSVVFDFVNQAVGESGDLYIPDSNRAVSLNAARSTPANILSKVNDNL